MVLSRPQRPAAERVEWARRRLVQLEQSEGISEQRIQSEAEQRTRNDDVALEAGAPD